MVREVDAGAGVQLGRRRRGGFPQATAEVGTIDFTLLPSRWAPYMEGFCPAMPRGIQRPLFPVSAWY